ncbi:hypothetical protein TWF730_005874 [Orbilia blumenaviensis]|uniref:Uncharacterized protein n=1 Tax=Orbilia blumenaviensis TaxID=1796055 RepID=A0AAV9VK11_9PEZI
MYLGDIIFLGGAVAAFASGILVVEVYKTLESIYYERKTRIAHETHHFGRPLKRKERKALKQAYQLDQMAATTGPNISSRNGGRGSNLRRRTASGNPYFTSAPIPPSPPEPFPKPGPFAD